METAEDNRIERILAEYDRDESMYQRFCDDIEELLRKLIESSGLRISSLTSRLKKRHSFTEKIQRDKYQSIRDVTDVAGVRIVTYFEDDVDKIASVIKDHFEIDMINSVDKRRTLPVDQFGYRSSHFVVSLTPERAALTENHEFAGLKIEVQVRSLLQHAWAEAMHSLGYKPDFGPPASISRRLYRESPVSLRSQMKNLWAVATQQSGARASCQLAAMNLLLKWSRIFASIFRTARCRRSSIGPVFPSY